MKYILFIASILLSISLFGQNPDELLKGNVSYISSQNVYVRFVNTEGIHIGDTLFQFKNNRYDPLLIVKNTSSISCVCTSLTNDQLSISMQIFARKRVEVQSIDLITKKSKDAISINDMAIENSTIKKNKGYLQSNFDGRLSISSYLNNPSESTLNSVFRYNLSLNTEHIGNSRLSAECNISLTNKNIHTQQSYIATDTNDVVSEFYKGDSVVTRTSYQHTNELRIYDLSVRYDFNEKTKLLAGRKINSNLANVGAVDGLQFESTGNHFSFGAVAGSRPDNYNYGLNLNLLQFGAFLGHHSPKSQTTLAVFNQMNNMITDRRFAYIQHSNSVLKNLDFFGSVEVDLYGLANNQLSTKLDLTSTYLSVRYRPGRKVSMALSYDARKNIYYYESFKNLVDSILDRETRQGLKFQTSYRPLKHLIWGGSAGFRFPTNTTTKYSANGYTYLTYSQLPLIDASLTIDATALKSKYTDGIIYAATLSRDFMNGKLFTEISYRNVNYAFARSNTLKQNMADISLSWRIAKKLTLSTDFEGTLDSNNMLDGRLFINISQRF